MSTDTTWRDYERALTEMATARGNAETQGQRTAEQQAATIRNAEARKTTIGTQRRTVGETFARLDQQVTDAMTVHRVADSGPAPDIAPIRIGSIAEAEGAAQALSDRVTEASDLLGELARRRGDRRTRLAGIAVVVGIPLLAALALLAYTRSLPQSVLGAAVVVASGFAVEKRPRSLWVGALARVVATGIALLLSNGGIATILLDILLLAALNKYIRN